MHRSLRTLAVGLGSGVLFALLDGALNANPLAQQLYAPYRPIARASVNPIAGVAIDLAWGLALAAIFAKLQPSLPGRTGALKGLSYGGLLAFLRVVMSAASSWVMFALPVATVAYGLAAGVGEMLVLGLFYGLTLAAPRGGHATTRAAA